MPGIARLLRLGILAAPLLLAFGALTHAAEVPKFEVDPFWPKKLPNEWMLGQVAGVAIDERDHIWIMQRPRSLSRQESNAANNAGKCCRPAPPVIEFDPDGNVVQAWGGPGQGYDWPTQEHGMRLDPDGNVWFGGNGKEDGALLKFTRDGKFLMQIGKPGPRKGDNDFTQLGQPADTWFDKDAGEMYVADGYGNHRIIVFDYKTGAYKRHWGAYGKKPPDDIVAGEGAFKYDPKAPPSQNFANPVHCVKIANDGLVYVCDRVNNRIQVFHKDGSFVREWVYLKETKASGSAWDIYFWPDKDQTFFINVDGSNEEFRVVRRSDGEVVSTVGSGGRGAGFFFGVHNVAVDSKGNVYTTEVFEGKRIQKFKVVSGAPEK
jgi:DNA-binding beta-propeller fold protein YncE